MLGKYFPIVVGIHADAATTTNQIYSEIKKNKKKLDIKNWTDLYLKERKNYLLNRDKRDLGKNFPIQPKGLFKQLRKVLPKDTAITLDAGTLCLQAYRCFGILQSSIFIYASRFWFSWFFFCLWS